MVQDTKSGVKGYFVNMLMRSQVSLVFVVLVVKFDVDNLQKANPSCITNHLISSKINERCLRISLKPTPILLVTF